MSNLKIDDLTIYTNKGRKLLDSFSFTLNEKDKVALIGEEGNGKSTLLKVIAGINVDDYITYSGKIITNGKIGYLPQSIKEEYLDLNTLSFIDEDLDYSNLYSLLGKTNIDSSLLQDRIVRTLSGGEKVKLALLKVLYYQPDILLLDEPTNDLDIKTLVWMEEFIKNVDLPIIFVSHDELLLENCSNAILHIEQFKRKTQAHIQYSGCNYIEYVEARNSFINKNNMIAKKEKAEFNKQLEKYRKIYQRVNHEQNNVSRNNPHGGALLKKKMSAVKALEHKLDIKKDNLTKLYEPEEAIDIFFDNVDINPNKEILNIKLDELKTPNSTLACNINLHVSGKDKICIIGDNGVGKSTFVKYIYSLLKNRNDIKLGYMPQNYYEVLDYSKNAVDFLMDNREYSQLSKVQQYLGALRFTSEEMTHKIEDLSEGQKAKILIVKLILDGCNVLLMDEPTRNLSALSNPVLRNIFDEFNGCIISVSHDRKFINEVCDKVYELDKNGLKLID